MRPTTTGPSLLRASTFSSRSPLARPATTAGAFAALVALAAACGGEAPPPAPPPPPPVASASAPPPPADTTPPPPPKPSLMQLIPMTMKGIADAFNAHDAKKVASFYTPDAVIASYGAPDAHGTDEIAKSMDMFVFATFGDAKEAPVRAWAKDNAVVVEMAWAGTMTGDFMGMKASKKPVGQIRLGVLWFNDDGLVKEQHEYGDDAGLMAQMAGKKGAPAVPMLPTNMPDVHLAKGTPDEDKLVEMAKGMDPLFSKDDPKAVVAVMADDADYWLNVNGGPALKGKKDIAKDLEGFFKAFPDQKWTTVNAWGIDGFAIVEHTMTGTQKGALGPLRASNKEVKDWHWIDIVQPNADGKVQHGWGYANLLEVLQQTGALKMGPEKPAAAAVSAPGPSKPSAATPAK
jgi:ketosteroid isomerase-like protein